MNIFFLHFLPRLCAIYHVDRHVVKMILESSQLLCTAIYVSTGKVEFCRPTHRNHPSAVWARANKSNWFWLKCLALELCKEYTYRYGKVHKYEEKLRKLTVPPLPDTDWFPPTPAMDDKYKVGNELKSYRNYYRLGKIHLHGWKKREIPPFINGRV